MRIAIDGSLIAPKRGAPPECPVGFVRDLHDPYVFRRPMVSCSKRRVIIRHLPCCGDTASIHCLKKNIFVTAQVCGTCKEAEV